MEIYSEYDELSNKRVTVYEYNADDEEPRCDKCEHVTDSQKICDSCGAFWINYRRREYEDDDMSQDRILEIYKRISEVK